MRSSPRTGVSFSRISAGSYEETGAKVGVPLDGHQEGDVDLEERERAEDEVDVDHRAAGCGSGAEMK
jgi:hypothetical protein